MLNTIRDLINQKREFMESAAILYEDMTEINLDDNQLFSEAEDDEEDLSEDDADGEEDDDDDEEDETPEGEENEMDGIMNSPLDVDAVGGEEQLPAPAEIPAQDDIDLMDVTVDLRSNTVTDVLPVPPMNASDALTDDVMSVKISSGFGDDDATGSEAEGDEDLAVESADLDLMNLVITEGDSECKSDSDCKDDEKEEKEEKKKEKKEKMEESTNELDDIFNEAITLGDDAGGEEGAEEPAAEEGGGEENVTDAVMDKVEEVDEEIPDQEKTVLSNELMGKLAKIQKDIIGITEDIRKAIV